MVHGGGHHGGGGARRGGGGGGGGSGFSFTGGGGGRGHHHGRGRHHRWNRPARRPPRRERIVVIDNRPAAGPRFWPRWVFQPTVSTRVNYQTEPLIAHPPPPPPVRASRVPRGTSAASSAPQRDQGGCCRISCCCCCCRGSFLVRAIFPLFVFFVLMGISGQHRHEKWVMNPGESRRVVVPGGSTLTKSVSIRHLDGGKQGGGDVTIWRRSGGCPPLTGPTVNLRESHNMVLSPGDYEFDYYHLNPGSRIDATLTPTRGGATLFLIEGKAEFERWEEDPDGGFGVTKDYSSRRFRPAKIGFKTFKEDNYYVAYDNPMGRTAEVTADISVTLTTYDVSKMRPIPPSSCYSRVSCSISIDFAKRPGCIVIQAEVPHSSLQSDGSVRNEHAATVEIQTSRRWSAILSLFAISFLLSELLCKKAHSAGDSNGVSYEEVEGEEEERPPPTVPGSDRPEPRQTAEPSAPPEADNEGEVLQGTVVGDGEANYQTTIPVAIPVPEHS